MTPDDRPPLPETRERRRWPSHARLEVAAGALLLGLAGFVRAGTDLAVLMMGLVVLCVVASLAIIKATARYRLAHLAPGTLWRGTANLDLAEMRASPRLASAAPRPGLRTRILLAYDLVFGVLTMEQTHVRWEPGVWSRWSGASPWRLGADELVAGEVERRVPIPGPSGTWLRLWLVDRSSISMQLTTERGLATALEALGIGHRRVL